MTNTALISIFCPDDVGLISAVSGCLFDLGTNLGDTTFAVLGEGAEFTAVAELPDGLTTEETEQALKATDELKDAKISVVPFELKPIHTEIGHITHRIEISGGDRPGLLARISETFVDYGANIVRLNSESVPGSGGTKYIMRIAAYIPDERTNSCLATVFNTASELGMACEWAEV